MAKGKKNKNSKPSKEPTLKICKEVTMEVIKEVEDFSVAMTEEIRNEFIYDVADFFKVFGDSTRIKMLYILMESELCVGDIAEKLDMTQSAVSHQLRVLRQSDLVKYRKDGKTVYYSLDDGHVKTVIEQGMSHIKHKKHYEDT